jgi:hypothetical protein
VSPYDPSQPREPKGSEIGGQWTAEGGAGARTLVSELVLPAQSAGYEVENPAERFLHPNKDVSVQLAREGAKRRVVESLRDRLAKSDLADDQLRAFARDFSGKTATETRWMTATWAAQGFVDQWAESSADSVPQSIAVQYAANDFMGSPPLHVPASWGARDAAVIQRGKEIAAQHRAVFDVVLGHTYERTQQALKEAGIETVELYRGMVVPLRTFSSVAGAARLKMPLGQLHEGPVVMQPLSSFSSNVATAGTFATEGVFSAGPQANQVAVMMAVRVPRTQVFATAQTGPGCLSESEFILFGGRETRAAYAGMVGPRRVTWFQDLVEQAGS